MQAAENGGFGGVCAADAELSSGPFRRLLQGAAGVFIAIADSDELRWKVPYVEFLLWCVLLIVCWPIALLAVVLYPFVWLLLIPFRLLGIAVEGVLELIGAIIRLPARVLRAV